MGRRGGPRGVAGLVLLMVLAGCSGQTAGPEGEASAAPTVGSTTIAPASDAPEPSTGTSVAPTVDSTGVASESEPPGESGIRAEVPLPQAQQVDVDTDAGFGPVLLKVRSAAFDPTERAVTVDLDIEMVTEHPDDRLWSDVAVTWGANTLLLDRSRSHIPAVAARGSGSAQFVFPVDPQVLMVDETGLGELAGASLALHHGWTGPTVVPFGDEDAARNEPTQVPVSGTLASPHGTVEVSGGRVSMGPQGDWPPIDHERAWLHVTYDVTTGDDVPFPGLFMERSMTLRLPDGSSVRAAEGVPPDLLVSDPHQTTADAVIGFPVPLPVSGDYQLLWGDDVLDFTMEADGYGAPPWAPRPLVAQAPACPAVASEAGGPVTELDRSFAIGAIAARLCQVEADPDLDTVWSTITVANPFKYRLWLGQHLGGLRATGGSLDEPLGAWPIGSDIPPGGSGMVRLRFEGVSDPTGLVLGVDTGNGVRDLAPLDPAEPDLAGPDSTLGVPVEVSGDLPAGATMARIRDAALLSGTFEGVGGLVPVGRRYLAVRFDFFADGAVPVPSHDPLDLLEQVEEFLTVYTFGPPGPFQLTTPTGETLAPVIVLAPGVYPREQVRGGIVHFDISEPVAGTYQLAYTNADDTATLDFEIPQDQQGGQP